MRKTERENKSLKKKEKKNADYNVTDLYKWQGLKMRLLFFSLIYSSLGFSHLLHAGKWHFEMKYNLCHKQHCPLSSRSFAHWANKMENSRHTELDCWHTHPRCTWDKPFVKSKKKKEKKEKKQQQQQKNCSFLPVGFDLKCTAFRRHSSSETVFPSQQRICLMDH